VISITGFVSLLKDGGLAYSTIQRPDIGQREISALFWINVTLSVVLLIIVAAIAPWIARLLDEPEMFGITVCIAFTMIFSSLSTQHQALLSRQMRVVESQPSILPALQCAILAALALARGWIRVLVPSRHDAGAVECYLRPSLVAG
jgi:PST family polysaccharide transporter